MKLGIAVDGRMWQEAHAIGLLIKRLVKRIVTNRGSANSRSGWISFINKGKGLLIEKGDSINQKREWNIG